MFKEKVEQENQEILELLEMVVLATQVLWVLPSTMELLANQDRRAAAEAAAEAAAGAVM
jgi:hypothetical protein